MEPDHKPRAWSLLLMTPENARHVLTSLAGSGASLTNLLHEALSETPGSKGYRREKTRGDFGLEMDPQRDHQTRKPRMYANWITRSIRVYVENPVTSRQGEQLVDPIIAKRVEAPREF